ncbi:hypothetical protein M2139_002853 [Enterococcus sp. PF1-24]|uniref:DUF6323 family protein n=1 Tax=unclassified Enterococcus TaxID=2608891 RepID=UPI00247418FA|nr:MULTISPECIES: DUF6323 family protein [unclassified Enterococcus]MDH6365831.1 hypothetical protein [Enterococcus sp. PFB1-1]MDH6402923.1 hypothetical protein [Enterococcus sp. PF1-24]
MSNGGDLLFKMPLDATNDFEYQLKIIAKRANYQITKQEVTQLLQNREEILKVNYLIDFSFNNMLYLSESLLTFENNGKRAYLELVNYLLEIFYYLRSFENQQFSDEEVIDYVLKIYQKNYQNLELTLGFFENHPNLEETYDEQ